MVQKRDRTSWARADAIVSDAEKKQRLSEQVEVPPCPTPTTLKPSPLPGRPSVVSPTMGKIDKVGHGGSPDLFRSSTPRVTPESSPVRGDSPKSESLTQVSSIGSAVSDNSGFDVTQEDSLVTVQSSPTNSYSNMTLSGLVAIEESPVKSTP